LALAEGLAARGHSVTLVGVEGSGGRGLDLVRAEGTPPFVPGQEVSEDPGPFPAALAAVLAWGVDVIHTHFNDPGGLRALDQVARMHPELRVVATLHLSAVFPATTRVVQALVDEGSPVRFVAPSHFAARSYGRGPAVQVVPNGVDAGLVAPQLVNGDGRLVWAGRRVPEKGLAEALLIARRAERSLHVAGPAGGTPLDRLAQRGVVDHGRLTRPQVAALFAQSAAVLITSSIAEAHPLVAIEALLAGSPVVGFDVGGLREIVDEPSGVLVPAGDVDAAVVAVGRAVALSRAACRARAELYFSERRMLEAYERVYTDPL
jgi:glycosyltransferase involved in cell wall biosynthesis